MAAIFRITFGRVVVVEVKKTLQKKHRKKPAQHPRDGAVKRMQLLRRIRQEMQQGDSKHETGDKTDGDLQAGV